MLMLVGNEVGSSNNMRTQCHQDDSMVHFQVQSDEKTSKLRVSANLTILDCLKREKNTNPLKEPF